MYLECRDSQTYFVDTLKFDVGRSGGLGIELLEVANNNEGVGIVVVDGTVAGSSAADSALQKGDVIAFVGQPGGPFESVEAKTWDDTVDALGRVEGDRVELVVKRLVKRPVVDVTVKHPNGEQPDQVLRLFAGENLRRAMLTRRVALNDPLARRFDDNDVGGDCGSGGACCTCAVAVLVGLDQLGDLGVGLVRARFLFRLVGRLGRAIDVHQHGALGGVGTLQPFQAVDGEDGPRPAFLATGRGG